MSYSSQHRIKSQCVVLSQILLCVHASTMTPPDRQRPMRQRAAVSCIVAASLLAGYPSSCDSPIAVPVDAFCPHHQYPARARLLDTVSATAAAAPSRRPTSSTSTPWKPRRISSQLLSSKSNDDANNGSILGASLLFAGTAIGAGMLALPAETLGAGFVPSISGLALCWAFTYITSIVTLEASWLATKLSSDEKKEEGGGEGGFLSISRRALGVPGEVVTGLLFWFLLTSIVAAYTAEGGQLITQVVDEVFTTEKIGIVPAVGSLIFATFFGSLATFGTSRVDSINRIFVLGLVATFVGLVGFGLPQVDTSNLVNNADWSAVYPAGISIGILSFGAQNVVPTLLTYLGGDPNRTRRAILFGSLTPLFLYTIWEAVFLGIVSADAAAMSADSESKMQVVTVLGQTGGAIVKDLVEVFSACAIGSSMAGASVSLVDFFQDAIGIFSRGDDLTTAVDNKQPSSTAAILPEAGSTRLLAAALALGPPVILAYAFPDIFLVALEEAGLLGGVTLYGILPALSILSLRRFSMDRLTTTMPGRLGGGDVALYGLVAMSSGLVLPEIIRLGTMLMQ